MDKPKLIEDFPIYEIAKPDLRRYGKPSRNKYPRYLTEDQHKQLQEDFRQRFARERFFGNGTVSYVYQRRLDPPCYVIFPNFPKLARVVSDLNLPKDRQATYYSTFRRGGDYVGATGQAYEMCQRFTVELFGILKSEKNQEALQNKQSRPDFWMESSKEIIEVRRTRVYSQPFEDLGISCAQPTSPYSPLFPYLESRWDPQSENRVLLLGGLDQFKLGFRLLEKFYNRAYRILMKAPFKSGRPKGSGFFPDPYEFWQAVVVVHKRLWTKLGRKPSQPEVAFEMGMALQTFKDNWGGTEYRWHELPQPPF